MLGGLASVFGLGFLYFISAIPAGAALGVPVWAAAIVAWIGYACGGLVIVLLGAPLRRRLMKKFRISEKLDESSLAMRIWRKYGLPVFGLAAPVTLGPQIGALIGMALGERPIRLTVALALGAVPWAVAFAILTGMGVRFLDS